MQAGIIRFICIVAMTFAGSALAFAQGKAPIKIGSIAFLTGKFSSYGKSVMDGVDLAAEKINAEGGLLGRKVEVEVRDTASEATQAISNLRRFDASSDVVGVVGPIGTPELLAILPVAKQVQLPVVTIASFAPLARDDFGEGVFRVSLLVTPEVVADVLKRVQAVKNVGRVGLLYDRSTDNAQVEAKNVRAAFTLKPGVDLVAEESYAVGDKSFSAVIDKMLRAKVGAIYLAGNTNEVVLIMQQARARGFTGPFIGSVAIAEPKVAELAGAAAVNTISYSAFFEGAADPRVSAFVEAYRKKHGEVTISPMSAYGYDAMMMLANAVRTANSVDRKDVIAALAKTKGFGGASGTYTFEGKGDNVSPRSVITEIKPNGKLGLLESK